MFQAGNDRQRHSADSAVARHGAQPRRRTCAICWKAAARSRRGHGAAYGAKAKLTYRRNYPVLVNHERETDVRGFGGAARSPAATASTPTLPPMMGAEDFSFMLNARPGAFIWVGNGDSAGLHHPAYNFNDEVIPFGTSYWVKLVETALAA